MIRHAKTRKLLSKLDRNYKKSQTGDPILSIVYSKAAILEVCGWLEEAFDEVAHNCVRERLRTLERRKFLDEKIKATHGFEYKTKARPLISHAIGVVRLLEIEKDLERDASLTVLKTICSNLNKLRQDAAHTTLSGRKMTYPAPSVAIQEFEKCLPIVKRLWELVRE